MRQKISLYMQIEELTSARKARQRRDGKSWQEDEAKFHCRRNPKQKHSLRGGNAEEGKTAGELVRETQTIKILKEKGGNEISLGGLGNSSENHASTDRGGEKPEIPHWKRDEETLRIKQLRHWGPQKKKNNKKKKKKNTTKKKKQQKKHTRGEKEGGGKSAFSGRLMANPMVGKESGKGHKEV